MSYVHFEPQGAEKSSLSSKTRQTPSYLVNCSIFNEIEYALKMHILLECALKMHILQFIVF